MYKMADFFPMKKALYQKKKKFCESTSTISRNVKILIINNLLISHGLFTWESLTGQ